MNNVYLIMPLEHGNGGWYGYEVLAESPLNELLSINPVETYLDGYYEPMFGSRLRICKTPNPNDPLFEWDHDECNKWEPINLMDDLKMEQDFNETLKKIEENEEYQEIWLCESQHLVLRPNILYKFVVEETCEECCRIRDVYKNL